MSNNSFPLLKEKVMDEYNNYSQYLNKENNIENITREDFGYEDWIPLDLLKVDINAQRNLMESQVEKILKNFTPASFGRITVSKRSDGFYYVQNGQHRVEALRRLKLKEAPCIVVNSNSLKEEAGNFIRINENSASVSSIDKYRIGVSAGDENWLRVKEVIEYCDFHVSTNPSQGISAISSIHKYINSPTLVSSKRSKMETMKKSLYILKESVSIESIVQTSILAMCIFTREYIDTNIITEQQAIDKFKDIDIKGLVKIAQTMKSNATHGRVISYLAWLLFSEYNKGSKKKLPLRIQP